MRLRLGTPRAALIVAPHADDEAIGAGKLIRALRQRGARVSVLVVTDGAASHPGSRRWPRGRLIAERRRETRRAMRRLGVPAGAIEFLGLPDGGLSREGERCRRAVIRAIAHHRRLDLLVGPSARDGHPDHRAVAAAMAAAPRGARRLTYPVWPPARRGSARLSGLPAGAAVVGKRSLIRCYRTQCGAVRDDAAGFSIARHELDAFAHPVELFREVR